MERTSRGFSVYGRVACSEGFIRVQRSSRVEPGTWLFCDFQRQISVDGERFVPEPLLSVDQARAMIAALQKFVEEAEGEAR